MDINTVVNSAGAPVERALLAIKTAQPNPLGFFLNKRNPARGPGVNHLAMACQGGKQGAFPSPVLTLAKTGKGRVKQV
jgi:hypothetical protein